MTEAAGIAKVPDVEEKHLQRFAGRGSRFFEPTCVCVCMCVRVWGVQDRSAKLLRGRIYINLIDLVYRDSSSSVAT